MKYSDIVNIQVYEGKDLLEKMHSTKFRYNVSLNVSLDLLQIEKISKTHFFTMDNKIYSNALISVKFNYSAKPLKIKDIREKLYNDGFDIEYGNNETIHYVRYKRSAGQSRCGVCLFIREDLYKKMMEWSLMNINLSSKIDNASFESYISLTLSAIQNTISIKPNQILLIDDRKTSFKEKVIAVSDKNNNLYTEEKVVDIINDIWDGQSLLDKEIFDINGYSEYSSLILRNKFFKTNALNSNIQLFMKNFFKENYNNAYVKDACGNKVKVSDIRLITTPNSVKYLKFDSYKNWINNIPETFGVVMHEEKTKYEDGELVALNYQILNTINLSNEDITELLQPQLNYLNLLKNEPAVMKKHLSLTDFSNRPMSTTNDFILNMLTINEDITKTKMYSNFRRDITRSYVEHLKQSRILVEGNYSVIFSNPYEMLLSSVGIEKQLMHKNECYTKRFAFNKRLLAARSPHIVSGNLLLVKNKNFKQIEKYFNLSNEICIVNAIDANTQQRLNGQDNDGDHFLITDNEILVKRTSVLYKNFLVPTQLVNSTKISEEHLPSNLAALDTRNSSNMIGIIVNLSQYLNSLMWDAYRNNLPYKEIYKDACTLAIMSCIAIDMAKRIFPVNLTKECNRLRNKYNIKKERPLSFKVFTNCYTYQYKNCPCDNLQLIVDKEVRKIRSKRTVPITISELFKTENINLYNVSSNVNTIIEDVERMRNKIAAIWSDNIMDNKEKYIQASIVKEIYIEKINKYNITTDEIKYLISLIDNKQIKHIRQLLTILYKSNTNKFNSIFKETTNKRELVEDNKGNITIYNKKYNIE